MFSWTFPAIKRNTPASVTVVSEKQTDKLEIFILQEKVLFQAVGFGKLSSPIKAHKDSLFLVMFFRSVDFSLLLNVMQVSEFTSLMIITLQSKTVTHFNLHISKYVYLFSVVDLIIFCSRDKNRTHLIDH